MRPDFEEFRKISMLVSPNKDLVIFPASMSHFPFELADGSIISTVCLPAYFPIELKYPYTASELADKIQYGIEQWGRHPCFENHSGKNTLEEKYYGVKGFKNAVKGNLHITVTINCEVEGNSVYLSMPRKRGYAYLGLDKIYLPADAEWLDFAEATLKFINMDITQLRSYKILKSDLNI